MNADQSARQENKGKFQRLWCSGVLCLGMDHPVHRGDTMSMGLHDSHQHSFVVWTTHSLLAASPTYHLTGSLVEDDDAQMMKVSLGCSEMGLSSHLQASKTGNTRFFTSNTHSSVVLQGFDQLRIEGLLCDVTLVAGDGDEAFPVHRAMMASSSDYFKAMFT
ncbi:hypothetical protein QQF64_027781, partial [Cirrhinus molitorella]